MLEKAILRPQRSSATPRRPDSLQPRWTGFLNILHMLSGQDISNANLGEALTMPFGPTIVLAALFLEDHH